MIGAIANDAVANARCEPERETAYGSVPCASAIWLSQSSYVYLDYCKIVRRLWAPVHYQMAGRRAWLTLLAVALCALAIASTAAAVRDREDDGALVETAASVAAEDAPSQPCASHPASQLTVVSPFV